MQTKPVGTQSSPGYGPAGSPPLRVEAFEAFPWRFLVAIRRSLLPMLELWHSADGCSFVHRRRPRKVSRGAGRQPMHAFGGELFPRCLACRCADLQPRTPSRS